MEITVNGKQHQIEPEMTIVKLLEELELDSSRIAVEHNLIVVSRDAFEKTTLSDGDSLEIVQFVGGG